MGEGKQKEMIEYTKSVARVAMLYGKRLQVGEDEWITVPASELAYTLDGVDVAGLEVVHIIPLHFNKELSESVFTTMIKRRK